jgi:hypothetical protein
MLKGICYECGRTSWLDPEDYVCYGCKNSHSSGIEDAIEMLRGMSEEDRLEVMSNFCRHCGTEHLPCYCSNDE